MKSGIDKLDSVKQAFKQWRVTRTKRGYIPDELWEQVKELLPDYTPSKIGIHLGLSPIQIRKKLEPQENGCMQFVEVKQKYSRLGLDVLSDNDKVCSVEVHRPCGSILKIDAVPMHMASKLMLDFMG
ncbi:hypothetical protein BN59_03056 [Legionella massiliensis]|uniref:Uncharacterized protein n=1 Tax=Legionella massiliensis TaxID=1034943 RepID=A0A078L472_9GAMM|nr:hypothetical protein [Legionella massiliensis]CDZ78743.1 hypothetical protein BN59_03056 [Legionella massiliensis]CEE14481.1 hypothetical protein BN1094_03056 [Legionella massiliensis]